MDGRPDLPDDVDEVIEDLVGQGLVHRVEIDRLRYSLGDVSESVDGLHESVDGLRGDLRDLVVGSLQVAQSDSETRRRRMERQQDRRDRYVDMVAAFGVGLRDFAMAWTKKPAVVVPIALSLVFLVLAIPTGYTIMVGDFLTLESADEAVDQVMPDAEPRESNLDTDLEAGGLDAEPPPPGDASGDLDGLGPDDGIYPTP